MSEHDDTLLDEDLGDEEYDLGNDEEEALLADDYELERQNSYKGEEETDDVLDLGVTDALDDLDGEDDNIEFNRNNTDKHSDNSFYKDGEHLEAQSTYYEHEENAEYTKNQAYQSNKNSECNSVNVSSNIGKGDLREKLQKNIQKTYVGNGQGMEDDDCEEAKERRNRFQSERTMISTKMNNDIPDNLENVVTSETSRVFRGRGRGRGTRGSRGGRFNVQNIGNFNTRFGVARQTSFDNQLPSCRPPLIENRPPCLLGLPNNIQNQQMMYQQANPQQPFQQFGPNNPIHGPAQFVENRPRFNPGQFQGPIGPRAIGPRLEYRPRGPVAGGSMQGLNYNCPPNQPGYHPIQSFQNPNIIMQENQIRPIQNNQNPILQGNLGCSLIGNPNVLLPGNSIPLLSGNLPLPMQGFPRQQAPPTSQGPLIQTIQNTQMSSQPPFENRPFQEPQFESRNTYDTRTSFLDQIPSSPFNNALTVSQQSASNVHSVSLPPGHKILINPHFRGAVQPANDTRLVWDSQAQPQPPISHSGQFSQSPPYQDQGPYHQSQQNPPQYQQNYQQNKSDDPYAYFSDVWQENRPQKHQVVNPSKQYTDNNYSRESNYNDSNKYKPDNQWDQRNNCQENHRGSNQNYRERDLPIRIKNDHMQRSRTPPNTYRSEPYSDHSQKCSRTISVTQRGLNRLPQKRISESAERVSREVSPKRNKLSNNRNLQEIRRANTADEKRIVEKKDEDNDPEMQEYRKKMEEQKRLREKILREKENRRKMAAIEKHSEDVKGDLHVAVSENIEQETKTTSALMEVVKDGVIVKSRPAVGKGHAHPGIQSIESANRTSGVRIIRTIPAQTNNLSDTIDLKDSSAYTINQVNDIVQTRQIKQQSGTRRVVIQKPLLNSQKVTTAIQKTVSNLQRSQGLQQKISNQQVQIQKTIQNQNSSIVEQKTVNINQRMIVHKASSGLQKTTINVLDGTNVQAQKIASTQNPQRIVIQKSVAESKKLPEIKTNTVKLENLAASTSEAQIKRMCQGIGTIESIHMGEGNATIVFKTQSAAMVFHKKYQRKMLDLSLITVRLMPHTASNKTITAVSKKS